MQVGVDQRDELVESVAVTVAPGEEKLRDPRGVRRIVIHRL
jgi:hypothetical protein